MIAGDPNAVLVERRDLTDAVAHFHVRPDDGPPPFQAGQYFALGLPVGERLVLRPYSVASASGRDLEFFIRRVDGGALTPRLWALRPGARLRLGKAKGLFTLIERDRRAHLFVATGTGLAPVVSMVETLLASGDPPHVVVVHGVAHASELGFRDRLERWATESSVLTYVPAVSRPGDDRNAAWRGRVGRLDALLGPLIDELALVPDRTVAYLCGNPAVVAVAAQVLAARGLPRDAIRSEDYWPLAA